MQGARPRSKRMISACLKRWLGRKSGRRDEARGSRQESAGVCSRRASVVNVSCTVRVDAHARAVHVVRDHRLVLRGVSSKMRSMSTGAPTPGPGPSCAPFLGPPEFCSAMDLRSLLCGGGCRASEGLWTIPAVLGLKLKQPMHVLGSWPPGLGKPRCGAVTPCGWRLTTPAGCRVGLFTFCSQRPHDPTKHHRRRRRRRQTTQPKSTKTRPA